MGVDAVDGLLAVICIAGIIDGDWVNDNQVSQPNVNNSLFGI